MMLYPVGKSKWYEAIKAITENNKPNPHARDRGLKRVWDNAIKAGATNSTNTTNTPASGTDDVTTSANIPKNVSSRIRPEVLG